MQTIRVFFADRHGGPDEFRTGIFLTGRKGGCIEAASLQTEL
jgi:hypothetical protein